MITVKTIKLKDINEKDLLYIRITDGNRSEHINVGEKTWNRINELINETKTKKEEIAKPK